MPSPKVLAETGSAVPLKRIGVNERFGQVGTPDFCKRIWLRCCFNQAANSRGEGQGIEKRSINESMVDVSFSFLSDLVKKASNSASVLLFDAFLWTKTKTSAVSFLLRLMENRTAYFRWEYLRFWWLAVTCQALFCAANAWWWQWNLGFYFFFR